MATGAIKELSPIPLSGVSSRTIDRSSELFRTGYRYTQDVGYVFSSSVFFVFYLWNGADTSATVLAINTTEAVGIVISGVTVGTIIPAHACLRVEVEVTKYGPLAFAATFAFVTTCSVTDTLTITGTRPLISTDQPRPIDLAAAMEEAYAYAQPEQTIYNTLEFASSGSTEYVRVVYSDEDLSTPQGVFVACKFEFVPPETESAVRGQMQISVDFLPREAQVWLRETSQARGRITVKWRQYLGANIEPDAEYPVPLDIISVEQTPTGVTATALFPDLINMPFPRRVMTTKELPGGIV